MILAERPHEPVHIGALILLDVPPSAQGSFLSRIREHISQRLAHTPLPVLRREAPDGYDSDVWVDVDVATDIARLVEPVEAGRPLALEDAHRVIAEVSTRALDPSGPPFHFLVLDRLAGGRSALYMRLHHAVADGVGVQTILGLLSDESPPGPSRPPARIPEPADWRDISERWFAAEAPSGAAYVARRRAARDALVRLKDDPATRRSRTPELAGASPLSGIRSYAVATLPFAQVKRVANGHRGTVNDLFLALASHAVRQTLGERGLLPGDPIVANAARSYRRPEHGRFGNRIVALHPHLATHLDDPIARLRAIQAAMGVERLRTGYDEAVVDQPERPYGARDRRLQAAADRERATPRLSGNVTLSNVPGPAGERSWAGYRQISSNPVPIVGLGRFLNITMRRNGDTLDVGVMTDTAIVPDAGPVADRLRAALSEYAGALGEPV